MRLHLIFIITWAIMINTVVPFERPFLTHKIRIIYRFYMEIKHIRLSTKYMFLTIFGEDFWTKRMEGYQNEIKYLVVVLTQHPTKQEYRILNLSRDTELDWTCLRCFCGIFFHLFCVCVLWCCCFYSFWTMARKGCKRVDNNDNLLTTP